MSFYSNDYFEAKNKFLAAAQKAGAKMDSIKISARGPCGEELTIDIASFGDWASEKVLIHSSGVHGVEGFAGSAVQIAALERQIRAEPGTALAFVHCLNPY